MSSEGEVSGGSELNGILDDVPLISLEDAVRKMDGIQFMHPQRGLLTFVAEDCIKKGDHSIQNCLRLSAPGSSTLPDDICEAIVSGTTSVDQVAAIRAFTGNVMCYAARHCMTSRDDPNWTKGLHYMTILISGLRSLPAAYHVRDVEGFRGESGIKESLKAKPSPQHLYFWSLASFSTDREVAKTFMQTETGERTAYNVQNLCGYNIVPLSFYKKESEIVVEPGTCLSIEQLYSPDKHKMVAENQVPGLLSVSCRFEGGCIALLSDSSKCSAEWRKRATALKTGCWTNRYGDSLDRVDCYKQAAIYGDGMAWQQLGRYLAGKVLVDGKPLVVGGHNGFVSVNGKDYTRQQCYLKALRCEPTRGISWHNLGITMSSGQTVTVNGTDYTQQQCYVEALCAILTLAKHGVRLALA